MKKSFFYIAVLSIGILGSCTQPTKNEIITKEIKASMEQNKAVGVAAVVVKDNQVIYNESFGYKDLENKIELQNGDLFRIASISKSFTATAIMQMIEQGKVDLEGDVSSYVGFKVRNPAYPEVPITIRMLLNHTSSLNDSEGYFTLNTINPDSSATYTKAYNNYEPGTKYEYCNLGFNTLGTILETASGERFDKYIVNKILTPMGAYGGYHVESLDSTKFVKIYEYNPQDSSFIHSPAAYAKRTAEIANYTMGKSTPIFSPTGGLKISAQDLAKAMMMHMNLGKIILQQGDKYNTKNPDKTTTIFAQLISQHSSELMQTKMANPTDEGDAYGFALRISDKLIPGKTMIGHTGSAYGVYTTMFWDSERKFGIIVFTNGCKYTRVSEYNALNREVTNILYNNLIATTPPKN